MMGAKDMSLKSTGQIILGLSVCFGLWACEDPNPISTDPSTNLETQVNEAGDLNLQSAQNGLTEARNAYFALSAPLLQVSTNVDAFQRVQMDVLPPMLTAANSLSTLADSTEQAAVLSDFQELFSEIASQMLNGINNNLSIYQSVIESPQTLGSGSISAARALQDLSQLFAATEYAERFTARLAAFSSLLSKASSVRDGLRSQQSVIINGLLRVASASQDQAELQQAYLSLVRVLTRPELLSSLADLARQAYGDSHVALQQTELTPDQPNPNLIQMVVQEDAEHYRFIRIENGQLVNELKQDSRGLSASDLLNQTNVVVVQENPS